MRQHILNIFFPACVLITFLTASPFPVQAAVVVLKNGDRITGRIVKMEERKLEVDSDMSSDIVTIKWQEVHSITTDRPMSVKLYSEADLPDNFGARVRDRIILYGLEDGNPIRLVDVRSINLAEQDYRGYIELGGNQTSGNTQTQALTVSGNLTYRKYEHRYILDGKYNRAQADNEDTANNGSVNIKYDYFLTRRLFTGAFNLLESDQFQNLSIRDTAGLMLGYDFLDSEDHLLSFSATWNVRYELRFRGDDVILFHKHQGFKDLGHGSATRVNAEQGIKVKIARRWRLNLEYDVRYNSLPVPGRKTTDTNIIIGFSYDLKP